MSNNAQIKYLDCCFPDYFQGCSSHVFALPLSSDTTLQDVIDGIEQEFVEFNEYTGFTEADLCLALSNLKESNRGRLDHVLEVVEDLPAIEDDSGFSETMFLYLTVSLSD